MDHGQTGFCLASLCARLSAHRHVCSDRNRKTILTLGRPVPRAVLRPAQNAVHSHRSSMAFRYIATATIGTMTTYWWEVTFFLLGIWFAAFNGWLGTRMLTLSQKYDLRWPYLGTGFHAHACVDHHGCGPVYMGHFCLLPATVFSRRVVLLLATASEKDATGIIRHQQRPR